MSVDDRTDHIDDLLPSYVAGMLSLADERDVVRHLEVCPRCRTSLTAWRAVAGALRGTSSRCGARRRLRAPR